MFSNIAVSASLLAVVSQVSALGSAIVQNKCSSNVYLWTTSNTPGQMVTIAPGTTYTEGYLTNPDGGGISMKLSHEPDLSGPITQYEYTIAGNLWYDISNINGFPFSSSGLTLTPSYSSCRSMICAAGVEICTAAYNQPDDNEATAACDSNSDTTLVLCSHQSGSAPIQQAAVVAPSSSYVAPSSSYVAPSSSYVAPSSSYVAPSSSYVAPSSSYVAPSSSYVAPSSSYVAPSSSYVTPTPSSTYVAPTTSSTYVAPTTSSTYVAPTPSSTYVAPTTSSTYVAPPPPSTSSSTTAAPAPAYTPPMVGGVTTTFVTQVHTVIAPPATTEVPESSADWSFFHHPASLGAFWNGDKEKREEHAHKPAAHRHHWQRSN